MDFMGFKGNDGLKKRLSDAVDRGSFSHAYIIWGPEGSGKAQLAWAMASAMLCSGTGKRPCKLCRDCQKSLKHTHPDIIVLDKLPDKRELLVDQIREIAREAYVLPNEADRKVFLINDADDMNIPAQNAFLKLLEEPPSYSVFILMGINPGSFLQTIRSRCVELPTVPDQIDAVSSESDATLDELAASIFNNFISSDKLSLVSEAYKAEKFDKSQLFSLLDRIYLVAAKSLISEKNITARGRIFDALDLLQSLVPMRRLNVGSGHIVGMLTAKLNSI